MAQISIVIVPAKVLKGGRHKIRIAISHNSETRYIVTDITIDSARQFRNGQVTGRPDANMLNAKLRRIVDRYTNRICDVEYIEGVSCAELVSIIKDDTTDKNMTVKEAFENMLRLSSTKESSQQVMITRYKSLVSHVGENLPIRRITRLTVLSYDKFLRKKKFSAASINNYMGFMFSLIAFARKCGVVDADFRPGDCYKMSPMPVRDAWLTKDEVRMIRDYPFKNKRDRLARDFFMLSYYLGGINLIDILNIDFNACKNGEIRYQRSKTEGRCIAEVRYKMPREAAELVKRMDKKNGHLWTPTCTRSFVNYHIREIRQRLGISNLIFYSARKSFSQHAFELGISTQVIDYILGHSMRSHGVIYHYVSVKPEMATEAIRKVIDNLNGKEEA